MKAKTKWRLLDPGDVIRKGDEFKNDALGVWTGSRWKPVDEYAIGDKYDPEMFWPIRRRLARKAKS